MSKKVYWWWSITSNIVIDVIFVMICCVSFLISCILFPITVPCALKLAFNSEKPSFNRIVCDFCFMPLILAEYVIIKFFEMFL